MNELELQRLALKLRRPPSSLAAFGRLNPEQFARLESLVERTCERLDQRSRAELRHALPWPVRGLLWPRSER